MTDDQSHVQHMSNSQSVDDAALNQVSCNLS